MSSRAITNKLSTTCLTLGILGWGLYLLQWCFDLTLGLLMAAVTAGTSALCATVLDFLPFVLWITGIVAGHVALRQIKQTKAPGRGRAIWGLLLGYTGMVFTILLIALIVVLVAGGVGVGILDKILPAFPRK